MNMGCKLFIPAKRMDHCHNARQIVVFPQIPFLKSLVRRRKQHVIVGRLADLEIIPKLRQRVKNNMFVSRIGKQDVKLLFPAFCLGDTEDGQNLDLQVWNTFFSY